MGLFWEGTLPGGWLLPFCTDVGYMYMMMQLLHIAYIVVHRFAFHSLFQFLEHRGWRYYEFSLHHRALLYTGMFVRDNALTWDSMLWSFPHVALFGPLSLAYTVEFGLF